MGTFWCYLTWASLLMIHAHAPLSPVALLSYGDLEKVPHWLLNFSLVNKAEYAARHHYSFVYRTPDSIAKRAVCILNNAHPGHQKWPLLLEALQQFQWVLWVDMDAFMVNISAVVQDFFPASPEVDLVLEPGNEGHRQMRPNTKWAKLKKFQYYPPLVNNGVMLWRSSNWSLSLLQRMMTDCLPQFRWDPQIHGTRTNSDQDTLIRYLHNANASKFQKLPAGTLQCQLSVPRLGTFIVHFPGSQKAKRIVHFLSHAQQGTLPGYSEEVVDHVKAFMAHAASNSSGSALESAAMSMLAKDPAVVK